MKNKIIRVVLITFVLSVLVWGFISPDGIRAVFARNNWSLKFINAQTPSSQSVSLPEPVPSHTHADVLLARQAISEGKLELADAYLQPYLNSTDHVANDLLAKLFFIQGDYENAFKLWVINKDASTLDRAVKEIGKNNGPDVSLIAAESFYQIDPERYSSAFAKVLINHKDPVKSLEVIEHSLQTYSYSINYSDWLAIKESILSSQKK